MISTFIFAAAVVAEVSGMRCVVVVVVDDALFQ